MSAFGVSAGLPAIAARRSAYSFAASAPRAAPARTAAEKTASESLVMADSLLCLAPRRSTLVTAAALSTRAEVRRRGAVVDIARHANRKSRADPRARVLRDGAYGTDAARPSRRGRRRRVGPRLLRRGPRRPRAARVRGPAPRHA